jgi:hypothetical protein
VRRAGRAASLWRTALVHAKTMLVILTVPKEYDLSTRQSRNCRPQSRLVTHAAASSAGSRRTQGEAGYDPPQPRLMLSIPRTMM